MQAVLLYKRTQNAPCYSGQWALIGGEIEEGETAESAVRREAREELKACGLRRALDNLEYLCSFTETEDGNSHNMVYYKAELNTEMDELQLKENWEEKCGKVEYKVEGEGLAWFTKEEICNITIRNITIRPDHLKALKAFFNIA